MDIIHIAYSIHDADGSFSKFTGVSIASAFMNTKAWLCIHLLHDNTLSDANRDKFIALVREHGGHIVFYNVEQRDEAAFLALPEGGRFSRAMFYRLMLGRLLPDEVKRVIYLDSDTVVHMDIADLWREETGANGIAAVPEKALTYDHMVPKFICRAGFVKEERYFNSGVLLIDMDRLREKPNLLSDGLEMLRRYPECASPDQDILNYFFADAYRELPLRYDVFPAAERVMGKEEIHEALYHFAGKMVDLKYGPDAYNILFFHYLIKTPWFDENFFLRALFGMLGTSDALMENMRATFNAASKKRVFLCSSGSVAGIRSLFRAREDEDIVTAIDETGGKVNLQEIVETLVSTRERGRIAVFVTKWYPAIRRHIIKAGFREGVDFVDGMPFIPGRAGGMTPSQYLIYDI